LTTARAARRQPLEYALEGSVFVAGATGAVAARRLKADHPQRARGQDAGGSVPDAGGVTLVPAFTGLGAPYWDASARGTIVGLTRGTTKAHIARATLEAIALQVADLLAAMQADSGGKLRELRVDGGAAASDLLMQLQADLLGVKVSRPANLETTALGAALLAARGCGVDMSLPEGDGRAFEAQQHDLHARLAPRWQAAIAATLSYARATA
jgi:glycerol kinase